MEALGPSESRMNVLTLKTNTSAANLKADFTIRERSSRHWQKWAAGIANACDEWMDKHQTDIGRSRGLGGCGKIGVPGWRDLRRLSGVASTKCSDIGPMNFQG